MNEAEKRAYCLQSADEIVERMRLRNKQYEARTGTASRVSEADYINARDEIERAMLRVAGLNSSGKRAARFHFRHVWMLLSRTPIPGTVNASLHWRCLKCGKEKVRLDY